MSPIVGFLFLIECLEPACDLAEANLAQLFRNELEILNSYSGSVGFNNGLGSLQIIPLVIAQSILAAEGSSSSFKKISSVLLSR
jgi:hypothetical protein